MSEVLSITSDQNSDAYHCMKLLRKSDDEIFRFNRELKYSGRYSVDTFLEHRPEFMDIGKISSTLALMRHESLESLFKPDDNWYRYLFQRMETSFERFSDNRIRFITFNYDRSLEMYLFTALQNSYGKKPPDVAQVISKIPIIHVHGTLGELPWIKPQGRKYEVTYDPEVISSSAEQIKVISETSKIDDAFGEARKLLSHTSRVIFLGFGYHKTNIQRLAMEKGKDQQIFGSCYGLTNLECQEIIAEFRPAQIQLGDSRWKTLEFLREKVSL